MSERAEVEAERIMEGIEELVRQRDEARRAADIHARAVVDLTKQLDEERDKLARILGIASATVVVNGRTSR